MVTRAWLGFVGVAMVLGACGKSVGSGPVTREQLPARAADIACSSLSRCCGSSGFALDMAACKRALAAEIDKELDHELEDAFTPNVRYDADAAGDCLDALAANSRCGKSVEVVISAIRHYHEGGEFSACGRIAQGTLPIGAECRDIEECQEASGQSVNCYIPEDNGPRVCMLLESTPFRRGKLGESCARTCEEGAPCESSSVPVPAPGPGEPTPLPQEQVACYREDGLYCNHLDTITCQPLPPVGATCLAAQCAGDAFCAVLPPTYESGICTAPRADGEACNDDSECQSHDCFFIYNDGVSLNSGTCVPADHVTAEQCAEDFDESNDAPPAP